MGFYVRLGGVVLRWSEFGAVLCDMTKREKERERERERERETDRGEGRKEEGMNESRRQGRKKVKSRETKTVGVWGPHTSHKIIKIRLSQRAQVR